MKNYTAEVVPHGADASQSLDAKVLWHVTMSADGFIATPDDSMDWAFGSGPPGPIAQAVIDATGAMVAGRRSYDGGTRPGRQPRGIYGGAWRGPVFVLTHRPPLPGADPEVMFLSNGIERAVATARQCLAHGLIDDIVMHLVPVLLGEGVRLYEVTGAAPIRLERIPTADPGRIVDLHFPVLR
jgi:dihydrofolate reductase